MIVAAWGHLNAWQRRFLVCVALFTPVLVLGAAHLSSHYRIAFDHQTVRCLPWWAYVIALGDHPDRGQLLAFSSGSALPFPEGTVLVKRLVGMPGDQIEVQAGEVRVNGTVLGELSDEVLTQLSRPALDFQARYTLGEDEFFVLGDAAVSFDSRYWGPVRSEDVLGRARGVL